MRGRARVGVRNRLRAGLGFGLGLGLAAQTNLANSRSSMSPLASESYDNNTSAASRRVTSKPRACRHVRSSR